MSESSVASTSRVRQQGVSKTRLASFLQLGRTLASNPKADIEAAAPEQVARIGTTAGNEAAQISGFLGDIDPVSSTQVQKLVSLFTNRQDEIARRRRQPGRQRLQLTGA